MVGFCLNKFDPREKNLSFFFFRVLKILPHQIIFTIVPMKILLFYNINHVEQTELIYLENLFILLLCQLGYSRQ